MIIPCFEIAMGDAMRSFAMPTTEFYSSVENTTRSIKRRLQNSIASSILYEILS